MTVNLQDRLEAQSKVQRVMESHAIALEIVKTMLAQSPNAGGDILASNDKAVTEQMNRIVLAFGLLSDGIKQKLEKDYTLVLREK